MTLIKQEILVFILIILYIREYLCVFTKLFTGNWVSDDFQFRVSCSRNNFENAQPSIFHIYSISILFILIFVYFVKNTR